MFVQNSIQPVAAFFIQLTWVAAAMDRSDGLFVDKAKSGAAFVVGRVDSLSG